MSKKEASAKTPEKKSTFQKAAEIAKQKEAEKKNKKNNKEKISIWKRIGRFFKDGTIPSITCNSLSSESI